MFSSSQLQQDSNRWKLFVCNTFLIPPAHSSTQPTCERQKDRATALGKMIHKHKPDVVLLQEMWGAGYSQLQKALAKGEPEAYDVPQDDWRGDEQRKAVDAEYKERASRHCPHQTTIDGESKCFHTTCARNDPTHPTHAEKLVQGNPPNYVVPLMMRTWWGIEFLDVATQFLTSRGGLYHAHNSNTVALQGAYLTVPAEASLRKVGLMPQYPRLHTFAATFFPKHRKSAMAFKATKSADPSAIPLLCFNTHLDPQNLGPNHRIIERQFLELKEFVVDVVEKEWEASRAANNLDTLKTTNAHTASFAAIITGDFNSQSDSFLFPRLFEVFEDIDLMDIPLEEADDAASTEVGVEAKPKKMRSLSSIPILRPKKRKVSVRLRSLLSEESLAVHTYCPNNVTVLYPCDDGRLDHLFEIVSISIETARDGHDVHGSHTSTSKNGSTRVTTINLQPVSLAYERVLNDHKGGDALVSDHYPFVAEIQVGGSR